MDKNSTGIKKKIAMAAVLVGAVLSILTFLFIHEVKEELWKQSVQTIIESTQQGCNTLKVQLMDDYQSMGTVTLNLREFASGQREELELLEMECVTFPLEHLERSSFPVRHLV